MGVRFPVLFWWIAVVAGLAAVVAVPILAPEAPKVWSEGTMLVVALLAAVRAVGGALRHREPVRIWLAAGVVLWTSASAFMTIMLAVVRPLPPYPTVGEALFLLGYACILGAVLTSVARHALSRDPGRWLDAVVAAVATAGVAVVVAKPWMVGSVLSPLGELAVAAFFCLDVLVVCAVLAGVLLTGGRPRAVWWRLGGGAVLLALTDLAYGLRIADPTSAAASLLDLGFPVALALLAAFAARTPIPAPTRTPITRHRPILPLVCSAGAIAVLVYDHYATISHAGLWLTVATLVLGLVRTLLVMQANVALADTERQALTDDLTGLGNRRRLYRDLDVALASVDAPSTLALFDLDGFKAYNDGHGHVAGDELLSELSDRLTAAIGTDGVAYRLGGDEFCVLATGDGVVERGLSALRADGIGASGGSVTVPSEATDASEALRIADMRMYADKALRRTPA